MLSPDLVQPRRLASAVVISSSLSSVTFPTLAPWWRLRQPRAGRRFRRGGYKPRPPEAAREGGGAYAGGGAVPARARVWGAGPVRAPGPGAREPAARAPRR